MACIAIRPVAVGAVAAPMPSLGAAPRDWPDVEANDADRRNVRRSLRRRSRLGARQSPRRADQSRWRCHLSLPSKGRAFTTATHTGHRPNAFDLGFCEWTVGLLYLPHPARAGHSALQTSETRSISETQLPSANKAARTRCAGVEATTECTLESVAHVATVAPEQGIAVGRPASAPSAQSAITRSPQPPPIRRDARRHGLTRWLHRRSDSEQRRPPARRPPLPHVSARAPGCRHCAPRPAADSAGAGHCRHRSEGQGHRAHQTVPETNGAYGGGHVRLDPAYPFHHSKPLERVPNDDATYLLGRGVTQGRGRVSGLE